MKPKKTDNDYYKYYAQDLYFYPLSKEERKEMKKKRLSMKEFVCKKCRCVSILDGSCDAQYKPNCFGRIDKKIGYFNY